jgi:diacylglycerol O-acyltransferase
MRSWLAKHDSLFTATLNTGRFRALVPVSLEAPGPDPDGLGGRVNAYLIDLPINEYDPADRLHMIVNQMSVLDPSNEFMGAGAIVQIAGFGPATMHALGARVASTLARRTYDLTVTNVPGPQHALYASGSEMIATYPSIPLVPGQTLSVGLTSYNGTLHIGLMSDRDAISDLSVLAAGFSDSVIGMRAALNQRYRRGAPGITGSSPRLRVVND